MHIVSVLLDNIQKLLLLEMAIKEFQSIEATLASIKFWPKKKRIGGFGNLSFFEVCIPLKIGQKLFFGKGG